MLVFLLILAAAVCFGIPAVRAILGRSFDYTNSGLLLLTVAYLVVTA
jgi:hypothetical protein